MFYQLLAEILASLIKGPPNNNNNNNNNNNKAKCIPGGTLRVLAGKKDLNFFKANLKFDRNRPKLFLNFCILQKQK
jgi:hypothetical protein